MSIWRPSMPEVTPRPPKRRSSAVQSRHSAAPVSLTLPARRYSTVQIVWTVLFILTFLGSYRLAQVKPLLLLEPEARRNIRTFVLDMFPPDLSWEFVGLLGRPIIETIQLSLMGTFRSEEHTSELQSPLN